MKVVKTKHGTWAVRKFSLSALIFDRTPWEYLSVQAGVWFPDSGDVYGKTYAVRHCQFETRGAAVDAMERLSCEPEKLM